MNKFISASVWNFIANLSIRILSLITYPFIVRNFSKGDISLFKAIQALIAILIATIPFGTKHLFISSPNRLKEQRWNVTFNISLIVTLILIIFVNLDKKILISLLGDKFDYINNLTFSFLILLSSAKSIMLISLMNKMEFKSISLALLIKQLLFYSTIIIFALVYPITNILIILLICSEILEVIFLGYFLIKKRLRFLPYWNVKFHIDKVSRKFLLFMGGEQVFSVLALHFPSIFVIYVMGKNLAPEFQLPFYAINIPASLVMLSVAKVIFPYMSELRENKLMRQTFLSVEFVITFITIPILICISLFSREIVAIIFEKGWTNAAFAVKFFPVMVFVNVLNNPFTTIASIKEKPQIVLIYSVSLFLCRMLAIYIGFHYWGFQGAIVLFIFVDVFIRLIRLKIDLALIELKIKFFVRNIRYNLLCGIQLIIFYITLNLFLKNKLISISVSLVIWAFSNYILEKERIHKVIKKILEKK